MHTEQDEHQQSMLSWLVSLRIPREQAKVYVDALLALGFDDIQSLQEDATEEDLHRANMKLGHARRAAKALRILDTVLSPRPDFPAGGPSYLREDRAENPCSPLPSSCGRSGTTRRPVDQSVASTVEYNEEMSPQHPTAGLKQYQQQPKSTISNGAVWSPLISPSTPSTPNRAATTTIMNPGGRPTTAVVSRSMTSERAVVAPTSTVPTKSCAVQETEGSDLLAKLSGAIAPASTFRVSDTTNGDVEGSPTSAPSRAEPPHDHLHYRQPQHHKRTEVGTLSSAQTMAHNKKGLLGVRRTSNLSGGGWGQGGVGRGVEQTQPHQHDGGKPPASPTTVEEEDFWDKRISEDSEIVLTSGEFSSDILSPQFNSGTHKSGSGSGSGGGFVGVCGCDDGDGSGRELPRVPGLLKVMDSTFAPAASADHLRAEYRPRAPPGKLERAASYPGNNASKFGTDMAASETGHQGDRSGGRSLGLRRMKNLQGIHTASCHKSLVAADTTNGPADNIYASGLVDQPGKVGWASQEAGAPSMAVSRRKMGPSRDKGHANGEVHCASDVSGRDGSGGGASDIMGISLELSIPVPPSLEQSYQFSESGTLEIDGFVLDQNGMRSAPTPTHFSAGPSCGSGGRHRTCKTSFVERGRCSGSTRPRSLATAFESEQQPPCSVESSFGIGGRLAPGAADAGATEDHGGGGRGGWGGGSNAGENAGGGDLPPPSTTTVARRMNETTILLEELGRGGGGTVHKALHVPSMRLVAVKIMQVHDDEKRNQLIRELKTLNSMARVPLVPAAQIDLFGGGAGTKAGRRGDEDYSSTGAGDGRDHDSVESWNFHEKEANSPTPSSWSSVEDEEFLSKLAGNTEWSGGPLPPVPGAQSTPATATVTPPSGRSSYSYTRSSPKSTWGFGSDVRNTYTASTPASASAATPGGQQQDHYKCHRRHASAFSIGGGGGGGCMGVPLSHLPIVAFHDAYTETETGSVCMVMEYMDGGTLQEFVSRGEALSERALAAVGRSVLRGLADMHSKHQIHRDIKPSNILLDKHGRVKLSDFGVVRELTSTGSLAKTFTGTLTYMSPERITHKDYSYPSDIWSLGLVIVALALGKFPLPTHGGVFEMMQAIANDPVPTLPRQSFTPELCEFVDFMLQREPADRPTACALLQHPFLTKHYRCRKVAELVTIPPATHSQVHALLTKIANYHMEAELSVHGSFPHNTGLAGGSRGSSGRWSGRALLSPLCKTDFEVLAAQLQVTRTELVQEYDRIRTKMERTSTGERKFPSRPVVGGGEHACVSDGVSCGLVNHNNTRASPPAPDQLVRSLIRPNSMPACVPCGGEGTPKMRTAAAVTTAPPLSPSSSPLPSFHRRHVSSSSLVGTASTVDFARQTLGSADNNDGVGQGRGSGRGGQGEGAEACACCGSPCNSSVCSSSHPQQQLMRPENEPTTTMQPKQRRLSSMDASASVAGSTLGLVVFPPMKNTSTAAAAAAGSARAAATTSAEFRHKRIIQNETALDSTAACNTERIKSGATSVTSGRSFPQCHFEAGGGGSSLLTTNISSDHLAHRRAPSLLS